MKKSQEVITADPGKMREFLIKVNTDVAFRKSFLEAPIAVLNKNGFTLSPEAKSEVEDTVRRYNKDVRDIAKLPIGYEKFLRDMGFKGKFASDSEKDKMPMGLV
jgi:hypothetical protein